MPDIPTAGIAERFQWLLQLSTSIVIGVATGVVVIPGMAADCMPACDQVLQLTTPP